MQSIHLIYLLANAIIKCNPQLIPRITIFTNSAIKTPNIIKHYNMTNQRIFLKPYVYIIKLNVRWHVAVYWTQEVDFILERKKVFFPRKLRYIEGEIVQIIVKVSVSITSNSWPYCSLDNKNKRFFTINRIVMVSWSKFSENVNNRT